VEPLNLTPEEVEDLTDFKQPARQIKYLVQHGWTFEVGASGKPKISRSYYDQRMGGKREKPRKGPRLEGLARMGNGTT
jgi:hypothetical protein